MYHPWLPVTESLRLLRDVARTLSTDEVSESQMLFFNHVGRPVDFDHQRRPGGQNWSFGVSPH